MRDDAGSMAAAGQSMAVSVVLVMVVVVLRTVGAGGAAEGGDGLACLITTGTGSPGELVGSRRLEVLEDGEVGGMSDRTMGSATRSGAI